MIHNERGLSIHWIGRKEVLFTDVSLAYPHCLQFVDVMPTCKIPLSPLVDMPGGATTRGYVKL